ncbi:hypothetical protein [Lysobacter enzymogenes]|uniref:hypothetical protein n=1 Tax=Lysobacter enzymogenes TaxID=69 RepID=UPI00099CBB1C|nr:hypothetical protein [Lysobacter enzymogenes]QQQ01645.1 hypothetical protein JHW41_01275 [Lysobacter enzymogenes]UZW60918.1 hypothetical protein BV903_001110 [Lysobacter enzymogenes]
MKQVIQAILAATMLATLCGAARAGDKVEAPVTLETNAQGQVTRAYGMIASARNSADSQQLIGCYLSASGSLLRAGCEARNAAGVSTLCFSTHPNIVAAAQAVGPDSYIDFNRDASGNCTALYVANNSVNPVKQP